MKHEWKKTEKNYYLPGRKPALITLPKQQFIMISGTGDPNKEDFSERVGILYSLAYPLKMGYKKRCLNDPEAAATVGYTDFTVYPLEGVWSTSDPEDPLNKDKFVYQIMIRQPAVITAEDFAETLAMVKEKKPHPLLEEVTFEEVEEGLCVQMLHQGAFDEEPASFEKMQAFATAEQVTRVGWQHREIYLSDPRRTAPENSRTVLRFQVKKAAV